MLKQVHLLTTKFLQTLLRYLRMACLWVFINIYYDVFDSYLTLILLT